MDMKKMMILKLKFVSRQLMSMKSDDAVLFIEPSLMSLRQAFSQEDAGNMPKFHLKFSVFSPQFSISPRTQ